VREWAHDTGLEWHVLQYPVHRGMQNWVEQLNRLYREQAAWSTAADARLLFNAYAGMLGLKLDRFKKDMESDEVKRRVTSDQQQGAALGVTVTPTIFINNRALPPASLNAAGLRAAIAAAIKAKSPP